MPTKKTCEEIIGENEKEVIKTFYSNLEVIHKILAYTTIDDKAYISYASTEVLRIEQSLREAKMLDRIKYLENQLFNPTQK